MWTLLAIIACQNPAPPDDFRALRSYITARCGLLTNDACRTNGESCLSGRDQTKTACFNTQLFRWSACSGVETDIDVAFVAECLDFLRAFDCGAPCDGELVAFDQGPCADVIAALEAGCSDDTD